MKLFLTTTIHTLTTQNQEPPLHMIVCGTAGTGKSYLINATHIVLQENVFYQQQQAWQHST